MKEMTKLELHYNKFNEEKRLDSRYGQVEFITSMKYIHKYLDYLAAEKGKQKSDITILDIGAGTGRYSVPLCEEGYDVSAIELVQHNLGRLKAKNANVKAYKGNALKLKRFEDESFDLTLLFGPMYHLYSYEDKLKALSEAKRVTKKGGYILVAYLMNEYSMIVYSFGEHHIKDVVKEGKIDESFQCHSSEDDLYDYMRIETIDKLNAELDLERMQILTPDGPANYIRTVLNSMDDEEFELFIKYHLSTCERQDLIGAAAHTLDVLKKQ